jgi:hypothetical protein
MPSHPDRVRKGEETEKHRKEIYEKAHHYLTHKDDFVRLMAQIVIFHYGDK